MASKESDALADRLGGLIDQARDAFKAGDLIGSLLLIQEAELTARKMPQKPDDVGTSKPPKRPE